MNRPLGMVHVAAVVVGAIIGVGIFFTPATLAAKLPSPTWVLGVWLLGGIASAAGALVFAELAGRYPKEGGIYVFLRDGMGPAGPMLAFVYGWQQLFAVVPCSMAIIALVLVDHVSYFTPIPPEARSWAAAGAIAAFTGANLLGLRTGGRIQVGVAALKLGALALLIAVGIGWGTRTHLWEQPAHVPVTTLGRGASWLVIGLVPVLFTFGGFQHGTFVAGRVENAERAVPRGIMAGVSLVLVAYLGVNVALLALLGQPGLATSKSPAADAVALAVGPIAGSALAGAIVISAAGILNTLALSFPFVLYAMARDGVFFARAGVLHARTGRPALAVALQGAWACLCVFGGAARIDVLLTGIAFADWTFHAAVTLVLLRVRGTPAPGVLRAPLAAIIAFLAIALFVAVGSLIRDPRESAYGAAVLLSGFAMWRLWRGRLAVEGAS
jgi:basic amino acid/polyamine antiporter, APA family